MPDIAPPPAPPAAPQPATPPETPTIQPRADAPPEPKGDQAADEVRQRLAKTEGFWNRISPKKEEPKPATPDPEPPKEKPAGEAPAPATPPAPEPEKPKRRKKAETPEIDPAQIAETTGRAIGDQIAKSLATKPATPEPSPAAEPELPEEFRRDTAVFEEMARANPKRYGDIKKQLAKYATAEDQYIAKWESEHPGEEFDGDSDEHDAFYRKVKPDYDAADFDAAKESLIEQRASARAKEELRKEWEAREAEREQRRQRTDQIRPELEREIVSLMGDMLKEADPDNAALAKDWASIQSLDDKNPLLADVMFAVHNETKPLLEASMRLFRGADKPEENNPVHQQVFSLIKEAERSVQKLPRKEQYDEAGRLFTTQDEYARMNPEERARHWFIGENELAELIRGRAKQRTKTLYDHERKRIERYTGGSTASPKTNTPLPKDPDPAPPPKPDTVSPSVSGRGSLPGDGQAAPKSPSSGKDWFFSKYIRS